MWKIILFLIILIVIFAFLYFRTRMKLSDLKYQKRSLSSKYGKMAEQFMPFLDEYPHDPQNFRFLGSPIDGVQFCDDRIIFMEFKVSDSKLSPKQKKIRDLIRRKKVFFEEHRI